MRLCIRVRVEVSFEDRVDARIEVMNKVRVEV